MKTHSLTKTAGDAASSKIPTATTGKSLYIHVPFCKKKCPYCHFYVLKTDHEQLFLEGIDRELLCIKPFLDRPLTSIYFGGGTPSQLKPQALLNILSQIPRDENTEITVEVNPEDASKSFFKTLRDGGFNRISFGVQSFDNALLKHLGRGHTRQVAVDAIEMAHTSGFDNITIDLMFEIPYQTIKSWQDSLDQLGSLPISHLSLYNLTFEENTPFYRKQDALLPHVPDSETGALMLDMAVEHLEKIGLKRYEISAFGHPSIHNVGYWTYRPTLGIGPSAFSYDGKKRFQNTPNLVKWAKALQEGKSPISFEERLEPDAALRERTAVGLRMLRGIPKPPGLDTTLNSLMLSDLIYLNSDRICLTLKGLNFYDDVASTIVTI